MICIDKSIHHWHISHNTPCLRPKLSFIFLLGITLQSSQEKLKTMVMQNFGGQPRCIVERCHSQRIYANLWERKKAFTQEKSSTPTGLVCNTNMAAVLLFWNTDMAVVMEIFSQQCVLLLDTTSSHDI